MAIKSFVIARTPGPEPGDAAIQGCRSNSSSLDRFAYARDDDGGSTQLFTKASFSIGPPRRSAIQRLDG
jgi:hypothetical protein